MKRVLETTQDDAGPAFLDADDAEPVPSECASRPDMTHEIDGRGTAPCPASFGAVQKTVEAALALLQLGEADAAESVLQSLVAVLGRRT